MAVALVANAVTTGISAATYVYEHKDEIIRTCNNVVEGIKTTVGQVDKVRRWILDWWNTRNDSRRSLAAADPKISFALSDVRQWLDNHPDIRSDLLNPKISSQQILEKFVAYKQSQTQPSNQTSNQLAIYKEPSSKPDKAQSGIAKYSAPLESYVKNGRLLYRETNTYKTKPAMGLYYSDNPNTLSSRPLSVDQVSKLSLEDIRDSMWLRDSLHAADAMTMACMFPGQKPTQYFDGQTLVPMNSGTLSVTDTFGSSSAEWTLMAWSPVIGSFVRGAGYWDAQGTDAQFNAAQTNTSNFAIQTSNAATGSISASGYTTLYTAAPPYTNNVFIWAGELSVTIETPQAVQSGTIYRALIPAYQFYQGLTWKQIQIISQREAIQHGKTYSIRNCVQNRGSIHATAGNLNPTLTSAGNLGNEYVAVIMIHNPAVAITTSGTATFDVVQKVSINYAFTGLQNNPWTATMGVDYSTVDRPQVLPGVVKALTASPVPLDSKTPVARLAITPVTPGTSGVPTAATTGQLMSSLNELNRPFTVMESQNLLQNLSQILVEFNPISPVISLEYDALLEAFARFKDKLPEFWCNPNQVRSKDKDDSFRTGSIERKR